MSGNKTFGLGETHGLLPDFSDAWNNLGSDVQFWVLVIIGIAMVAFVVTWILSNLFLGTKSNISAIDKDSSGRKSAIMGMGHNVLTAFIVVICLALIFKLFL